MLCQSIRALLLLFVCIIPESSAQCFVETPWEYLMERLVSETYVKMTAELCMEGCLSLSACTGISRLGRVCILLGEISNVSSTSCFPTTYLKRVPGCINPASKVSLKVGDAVGKQISFIYNVWTNKYTYAGTSVAGEFAAVQSKSNAQFIYEPGWKCKYLNRIDNSVDAYLNYQIDFPAEQVASIEVTCGSHGFFGTNTTITMQSCSWTICQNLTSYVPSLLEPNAGSILSSPFRFSIQMGGGTAAKPQIFRYMQDASNPSPRNLEIVFNLK